VEAIIGTLEKHILFLAVSYSS